MDSELYDVAAEILRKLRGKRASLKTLVYASKYKNVRRLFALVSECSKHRELIEEVLTQIADHSVVNGLAGGSSELAVVLLYEYLLGHKFGRDVGLRKLVHGYKDEIAGAVGKVVLKHQAKTLQEIVRKVTEKTLIRIPRYMRVNLIKSSVEDVVDKLVVEGWNYVGKLNINDFTETAKSLDRWQFALDPLLFDLLVFPVGTDLHDHPLTKSGLLIQQDRASCVPAHVLKPARGSVVLDCCSAPGNKTSHLASLMCDTGRVIALDRDHKRMETMSRLIETSGASCVEMIVQDFLTVRPDSDDARDIHFILVDPSCSGSGMLGSSNEKYDSSSDEQRIQTLKRFQISILKHALRFPAVQRVVYSTCSIHAEENEQVVEEVMAQVSDYFKFKEIFPPWKCSRGLNEYPNSNFFLRLSPDVDLTQGFFVACFERIKNKCNQPEDEVAEENSVRQVSNSKEVKVETPRNLKVDSCGINKSHSKKRKTSGTNKNKSEDETEVEHRTGSIKASNMDIQTKRKQKVQKTVKSDLELGTSFLTPDCISQKDKKPRLLHDVIPLDIYENKDVFVQNSEQDKKNIKEGNSRNKNHKKEELKLDNNICISSKKKKHRISDDAIPLNIDDNNHVFVQNSEQSNKDVTEESSGSKKRKKELIPEPSLSDESLSSVTSKLKKKERKEKLVNENVGLVAPQKKHKTESGISYNLNSGSHEKLELISEKSVQDEGELSNVCDKRKKKKKKKT